MPPERKPATYKDLVVELLEAWRTKLVDRVAQFHEARRRYKEDPTKMVQTAAGLLSITDIVRQRIPLVVEARSYVATLEEMLSEVETSDSTFALRWSDDALVEPLDLKSPLELGGK